MKNQKEEILALWANLFVAQPLAIKRVEALIKDKSPLGLDEYDLLLVLSRQPEYRCRLSTLVEETLYSKSGVSRVAKRLEERGLLNKSKCAEDLRGAFVELNDNGIKALKETWAHYSQAIITVLESCFNLKETEELRLLLGKLIEHLRGELLIQLPKKK